MFESIKHYKTSLAQLERAVKLLNIEEGIYKRLQYPRRSMMVSIPIKMDNGDTQVFIGYRVQHSMILGPCKGGIRYHPEVTLEEVASLAMNMTWKCSLANLPYGGAKGAVKCDPYQLSEAELERLTRRFTSELSLILGPEIDIPAPDVGTNSKVMAWMMDTYSMQKGYTVPGIVTGKPIVVGGSPGRDEATGRGVIDVLIETLKVFNQSIENTEVAIQGFGNVGYHAARLARDNKMKVIAISDVSGGIYNSNGIDIDAAYNYVKENSFLKDFKGGDKISNEELLTLKCDALLPCALSEQITEDNADKLKCKYIIEGANGPTTTQADEIIQSKNIFLVPDILANSGGVIVSYFEWLQDISNYFWTLDEVNQKLNNKMKEIFYDVYHLSKSKNVYMRDAALMKGVGRVVEAMKIRGLYP